MPLIQALARRFTVNCCIVHNALARKSSILEDSLIIRNCNFAGLSTREMLLRRESVGRSPRKGPGLSVSLGQPLVDPRVRAEAGREA